MRNRAEVPLLSDTYLKELMAAFPQRVTVHSVSIDGERKAICSDIRFRAQWAHHARCLSLCTQPRHNRRSDDDIGNRSFAFASLVLFVDLEDSINALSTLGSVVTPLVTVALIVPLMSLASINIEVAAAFSTY